MQFGMIGLGRMGANMVRRLMKNGHACVVYDRSAQVVEEYAGCGVRLIRHPSNLGSSPARTRGMSAAEGDWIVRLDSDDELVPGALATAQRCALTVPSSVGRIGLMYRYTDGRISPFPPPNGDILSYEGLVKWLEISETYDGLNIFRRRAIEDGNDRPGAHDSNAIAHAKDLL